MPALTSGSTAPDFELPDQNGNPVRLSQYRGKSPVVVYFYPKDDTSGCTIEACRFRDDLPRFRTQGAEILGISGDSGESHLKFAAKYDLPFTLLTDKGGRVRKLFGVKKTFGLIPGRVTFVIDRDGIVRHVFSSQSEPARHVEEALAALAALPGAA
ncbi:MAG TPA: peroxiredoxin [Bryobacteraceae bacterium]|nr:peroxiredoxin [Bryobacteraceae bacterium]